MNEICINNIDRTVFHIRGVLDCSSNRESRKTYKAPRKTRAREKRFDRENVESHCKNSKRFKAISSMGGEEQSAEG